MKVTLGRFVIPWVGVALYYLSLTTHAWVLAPSHRQHRQSSRWWKQQSPLYMTAAPSEEKLAKQVTGEELEIMLTEWDQPLVVDAYATW